MEMTKLDYYEALYQRSPKYLRFYKNTVLPLVFLCYLFPIAWQILNRTVSDSEFSGMCWSNGAWMLAAVACFVICNWQHFPSFVVNMAFCSVLSGTVLVRLISKLAEKNGITGIMEQLGDLSLDSLMSTAIFTATVVVMLLGVVAAILALVSYIRHAKLFITSTEELRQSYEKQENP